MSAAESERKRDFAVMRKRRILLPAFRSRLATKESAGLPSRPRRAPHPTARSTNRRRPKTNIG